MSGLADFLDDMELINVGGSTAELFVAPPKKEEEEEKVTEEDEEDEEVEEKVEEDSDNPEESEEDVYQRLDADPTEDGYLLIVNGKPRYYVKTLVEAKDCIWHIARCLVDKLNPNYNIYYTMPNKYTVNVERRSRWAIISYDEIVHSVSLQRIKGVKLVEVPEDFTKETMEEKPKKE